jgi:hypothetical protein
MGPVFSVRSSFRTLRGLIEKIEIRQFLLLARGVVRTEKSTCCLRSPLLPGYSWGIPPRTEREMTCNFLCGAVQIVLRSTEPRLPSAGIPGPRLLHIPGLSGETRRYVSRRL